MGGQETSHKIPAAVSSPFRSIRSDFFQDIVKRFDHKTFPRTVVEGVFGVDLRRDVTRLIST